MSGHVFVNKITNHLCQFLRGHASFVNGKSNSDLLENMTGQCPNWKLSSSSVRACHISIGMAIVLNGICLPFLFVPGCPGCPGTEGMQRVPSFLFLVPGCPGQRGHERAREGMQNKISCCFFAISDAFVFIIVEVPRHATASERGNEK